ncbi:hypothetical protein ACTAQI_04920 [Pseudarthrobacter sp. alpha12b]
MAELFAGGKAELAKVQAARIAGSIHGVMGGGERSEYSTIRRASAADPPVARAPADPAGTVAEPGRAAAHGRGSQ